MLLLYNSFKWQYMAGAGAGAGAEMMANVGAGNKQFRLRNTGYWLGRVKEAGSVCQSVQNTNGSEIQPRPTKNGNATPNTVQHNRQINKPDFKENLLTWLL